MNPHIEPDNNPSVAHEHTDADSRSITRFGISLAFLIVLSQLLLWWVFDHLSDRETKLSPHVPAIVKAQGQMLPPEPRLQGNAPLDVNPRLDLKQMRANEDAFLNHYGWIDPDHGIVHVPINEALDVVAKTGLPKFKLMEPKEPKPPSKIGSSRLHNPQFGDWLRNSEAHDGESGRRARSGISLPVPELPTPSQQPSSALASSSSRVAAVRSLFSAPARSVNPSPEPNVLVVAAHASPKQGVK